MYMWFYIGLCLSGWCSKMHLRADYFVTDSPAHSPGRISTWIFWLSLKERRMLTKRDYQGRLSFHFFDRWMTALATHRQKKVQAMSWKNLQVLEFCLFTWSWMGPINCAPNPDAWNVQTMETNSYFVWYSANLRAKQNYFVRFNQFIF